MQLFNNYVQKEKVKAPTYYWQQVALEVLEYLEDVGKKQSQVFRWAKRDESKLKAVIDYMKSRNIKNFRYLAAVMTRSG